MNARKMQDAMIADLTELFKERKYKSPEGTQEHVQVFAQNLPRLKNEDDNQPFPHIIVRLDSGNIESRTDPHKVQVLTLVGIYDDDLRNQGHIAVTEILELIQEHYEENPILENCYKYIPPFNWALQDEESWPYFYGGAQFVMEMPRPSPKASDLV